MSRPVIITGNWKMYKTVEEAALFVKNLAPLITKPTYIAVPFTAIKSAADNAKGTQVVIGAQNMHDASEGAFTGEIAAKMLLDAGARFVILGHSERRRLFNETNALVNKKIKRALSEKIQPLLCIGETLEQREAGKTEEIIRSQLLESLADVQLDQHPEILLAYEPVWAVGTDMAATPEMAQEAHHFCRQCISEKWGEETANKIVIQYGGSVHPDNAQDLLNEPDIDGLLVGGASLTVESFSQIANLGKSP